MMQQSASVSHEPKGSPGYFKFISIIGFMGMTSLIVYQRRLLADSNVVAHELKLVHAAEKFLSRALKEKDFADAKLHEGAGALAIEEKLMSQAEVFLQNHDQKGLEKVLKQEELQEKLVEADIKAAKAREAKARNDETAAIELSRQLSGELSVSELMYDHREELDALSLLNASLAEFEKMDNALEARQRAIHANLQRMKRSIHGSSQAEESSEDAQSMLLHEKAMAQEAETKESEAQSAAQRADKTLQNVEVLLKKHKGHAAKQKLKEEEKQEKAIAEALVHAQSLLESARHDSTKLLQRNSIELLNQIELNQTSVELTRLERYAKELQERRDETHKKHDHLKELIRLEEKRKKLITEEKRRILQEKERQKHAHALQKHAEELMKTEAALMVEFQDLFQSGDRDAAAAKAKQIEKDNYSLMHQFEKLKTDLAYAHAQVSSAHALSERLNSSEMVSVGGQDASLEQTLSSLTAELKNLESWEATAIEKHQGILAQLDSMQESQGGSY